MIPPAPSLLEGEVRIRVPFPDADPAGVVWHGRYFDYFDQARCNLLEKIDYGYKAMAQSGFLWPVVEVKVKYVRAIEFDEVISVRARLVESEYRLKISYEICNDAGVRCTTGYTVQVAIDAGTGALSFEVPSFLRDRIVACIGE